MVVWCGEKGGLAWTANTDDSLVRRTFINHTFADSRTLAGVRDAAGHANVNVTSAYPRTHHNSLAFICLADSVAFLHHLGGPSNEL